jgi:hypothetical protein
MTNRRKGKANFLFSLPFRATGGLPYFLVHASFFLLDLPNLAAKPAATTEKVEQDEGSDHGKYGHVQKWKKAGLLQPLSLIACLDFYSRRSVSS